MGKLLDLVVDPRHLVEQGDARRGLVEGDDDVQLRLGEGLSVDVDDCGPQRLPVQLRVDQLRDFVLKAGEAGLVLRREVGADRLIRRVGDLLHDGGGVLLQHALGVQQLDQLGRLGAAGGIVGASGDGKAEDENEEQGETMRTETDGHDGTNFTWFEK